MHKTHSLRRSLLSLGLVLSLAAPAAAGIEDRDNHSATGAGWAANISLTTMNSIINQGFRVVDLEVTRTSPSTLVTISYVRNSGTFKKTWWWAVNQTGSSLSNLLSTNKARLTDLEVYTTSNGLRFAALMESNTSTNAKSWWWYYNTSSTYIYQRATALGARVVDMERYTFGSSTYYAAVLLRNTGGDYKPVYNYLNVTSSYLASQMSTYKSRIWDLDYLGSGRYNATLVKGAGEYMWWWLGQTGSSVTQILQQYGGRIIDIEQYSTVLGTRYNIVVANAVNALSRRVANAMLARSDGFMGTYLQRVTQTSGTTLAYINGDRKFEPASTLKALHLLRAMRDVQANKLSLTTNLLVKTGTNSSNSCPYPVTPYYRPLKTLAEGMMRASDNNFTKVFTDRYTMAGLNSQAAALSMTNTKVNHHIGCGSPPNTTTLVDMGKLYAAVARGYLGSAEAAFLDAHGQSFYTGGYYAEGYMGPVIDQEAAKVGLTSAQKTAFRNAMVVRGKKGGYGVASGFHRSWAAYVRLPIWVNGGQSSREYVTGAFVNNGSNEAKAIACAATGAAEVLRDEIRAAMLTLKNHVFGSTAKVGTSCKGNLSSAYAHSITGTPELGQKVAYLAKATRRGNNPAMFYIGVSKTFWNRVPLPFDLGVIGAPGCDINIALNLAIPTTSVSGLCQLTAIIPNNKTLLGRTLFTQFLVADPGANAAGLTSTNGMATYIGGQK